MTSAAETDKESRTYRVHPIGYVRSPYEKFGDVGHVHDSWTKGDCFIELTTDHKGKLKGLDGYSHLIVLFWLHKAGEWRMPKNHHLKRGIKLFATRMPKRPNPIGFSVVKMLNFSPETGRVMVHGLDALDGTPIVDIKPYIRHFDSRPDATLPEWVEEHLNSGHHSGCGHSHAAKAANHEE